MGRKRWRQPRNDEDFFPNNGPQRNNEHDDRTSNNNDGPRRVSFKNHSNDRRHRNNRQAQWVNKIVRAALDEDIDMSGGNNVVEWSQGKGGGNNQGRRNRPGGSGVYFSNVSSQGRALAESLSCWYKVTVRHGQRYEREYVLKVLENYIKPIPMIIYTYKTSKEDASFLVDEHATAQALYSANRKITCQDGWKLVINVRPYTPFIEIDDKITATIKKAMAPRFNAYNKALNLSKFHSDMFFIEDGILCPLNRPNVMIAVLGIIGEAINDLVALDLSDNKINATEHLKMLVEKAPNLKALNLRDNKIREVKQLDSMKGLPLEEINLDGNSMCTKFTDRDVYVRAIRQRFPKVIKLDGLDLPPPILFDIEDEGKLPPSNLSFMADLAGEGIVKTFLEQFYRIYDSDSRQPLVDAYHDEAQFSLDVCSPSNDGQGLGAYILESRNLIRVSSQEKRVRFLHRGKHGIVNFLATLPPTEHDPHSFTVDLVIFTPQLIELCLTGLFRERNKRASVRFFSRVFIICPMGSGFCVINEQLTLMPATPEQAKKCLKAAEPTPVVVAPPAIVPSVPASLPTPPQDEILVKQQMVTTLSLQTGMNLQWSEKCLQETSWNFDHALLSFTELQKAGTIPQEAFIK